MKKIGRIVSLIAIILLMSTVVCFADNEPADILMVTSAPAPGVAAAPTASLVIDKTYPEDGNKSVSLENMGVKVYTNGTFTAEKLGTKNDNAFQLFGPEGEKIQTKVLYSTKEPGMILVLTGNDEEGKIYTGVSDADYELQIYGTLVDDNGLTLGSDMKIALHTINQKRNNTINTIMMFVMFGGILILTMFSQKKNNGKEANAKKQTNTVNPYKEAKKTGKSVTEIVEKDKVDKKKQAEKNAKVSKKSKNEIEYMEIGHYQVRGRKSALAGGSEYCAKKKAAADARREKEAKWKEQAKKKSNKK